MKITKTELVELISEVYNNKVSTGSDVLNEASLKNMITGIVRQKLQEMDLNSLPKQNDNNSELIEDDFGFAAGMNKAIKGRLNIKNCKDMQSLLWKAVTNELTSTDRDQLRKYWLTVFDNAIEEKFIGKKWYPFTEDEIESTDKSVESIDDADTNFSEKLDISDTDESSNDTDEEADE